MLYAFAVVLTPFFVEIGGAGGGVAGDFDDHFGTGVFGDVTIRLNGRAVGEDGDVRSADTFS